MYCIAGPFKECLIEVKEENGYSYSWLRRCSRKQPGKHERLWYRVTSAYRNRNRLEICPVLRFTYIRADEMRTYGRSRVK
jgi:hypothetical protein